MDISSGKCAGETNIIQIIVIFHFSGRVAFDEVFYAGRCNILLTLVGVTGLICAPLINFSRSDHSGNYVVYPSAGTLHPIPIQKIQE